MKNEIWISVQILISYLSILWPQRHGVVTVYVTLATVEAGRPCSPEQQPSSGQWMKEFIAMDMMGDDEGAGPKRIVISYSKWLQSRHLACSYV